MALSLGERPRRLRRTAAIRDLVRETRLHPADFIYPLFVRYGRGEQRPVASMPGVFQWSPDTVGQPVGEAVAHGVQSVLLFGIPEVKDGVGSGILDPAGPVPEAVQRLKEAFPEIVVMADLCLCDYTDHGHCGLLRADGSVDNDSTVERLAEAALVFAAAGVDVVAPSDMMDGRVGAIRRALDEAGYTDTLILSYAVKYASGFYAPFREAAENRPAFGDRKSYQMDPGNRREALREARLDVAEGADLLMVKPALPYLDVLADLRRQVTLPLAAYQVSGEYAMLKAAAQNGWLDERTTVLETLTGIRRAGADLILTYFASEAARWLSE
jgi:porphobilinogen synthase